MCLQNTQRSTGYVKTKNGQVPVLFSEVRPVELKGATCKRQRSCMNFVQIQTVEIFVAHISMCDKIFLQIISVGRIFDLNFWITSSLRSVSYMNHQYWIRESAKFVKEYFRNCVIVLTMLFKLWELEIKQFFPSNWESGYISVYENWGIINSSTNPCEN